MRTDLLRIELTAAAAAIVLGTLAGCAGTHEYRSSSTAALPGTAACFYRRNFYGSWQVLNNSTLILYTSPGDREAYWVKLFQPAVGLKFNFRLGFYSVSNRSQICGDNTDYLIIPGNSPRRVLITSVRRLTVQERDQLLAEAGKPIPHRDAERAAESPR